MNQLDKAISDIAHEPISGKDADNAAARVRQKLFGETAGTPNGGEIGPQRLRSCTDFQALIPTYLNRTLSAGRSLLLQDHTRECIACRHALQAARAGTAPTLIRPVTPPTRTISHVWAIAATATVGLGLGGWFVNRAFFTSTSGPIAVQTVSGTLYAVSDRGSQPIFAGHEIAPGQRVRTAKDSTAVIRLSDGSLVEMNARAELAVLRESRGTNVRLDRGNIIVQAAKQRTGTLDILTPDCTVSVKGTIFAVARGTKGTRVSVVQGAVKVAQGAHSQMLKPGDQVSTDTSLTQTPVREEIAWSRDSVRYAALLNEFNTIKQGIEAMPSPGLRYQSKLLPLASPDTVLYAAIPNVSATLAEAQKLFNDRLQQSEVLRAWWAEQQDGPKLQQMVDTMRRFSEYLGNEVVFTISSNSGNGEYSEPLIMAEVKLPGLEGFLATELRHFSQQGLNGLPEVVHLEATTGQTSDSHYWRNRRRSAARREGSENMLIGVKDGLMVIGWNKEQLAEVAQRSADQVPAPNNFLMNNVRSAYQNGAGWLFCVNMEHIARDFVGNGRSKKDGPQLPKGIDNMRDLIVERKEVGGRVENTATLTFEGKRWGMAAWLAEPSPMGSLDFVSPNATLAVSMALRNPTWMLGDLFRMLSEQDPKFEEELERFRRSTNINLTPSLADPVGGEFTFAIDGPVLPLPSWKFAIEVYSPERLQWAIEQFVNAGNSHSDCTDCKITINKEQVGQRTFYSISSERLSYEIDYVFVDGYMLAAPSRTLLNRAIQNRETGYTLSRSDAFRSHLPKDGRLNFSALIYHNVGPALAPIVNQLGAGAPQRDAIQAFAANAKTGLIYAYGEPERITLATDGGFFGLDLNSLALPNLLGMGGRSPRRDPQGRRPNELRPRQEQGRDRLPKQLRPWNGPGKAAQSVN
jgi:hypothetical protein